MLFGWNIQEYIAYRSVLSRLMKSNAALTELQRVQDVVDSKSSALLTHVSIMIAACAFLYEFLRTEHVLAWLVLSEAVVYIAASLLLVFSVNFNIFRNINDENSVVMQSARASLFRIYYYKIAHTLTVFATTLLIGTIIAKVTLVS
jgi:hypothetical protein